MGEESPKVEVCVVGVAVLWLTGVVLLCWDTLGGPSMAGQWALYLSAAAASWTIIIAQARCRRRMVAAVAREIALSRRDDDSDLHVVR